MDYLKIYERATLEFRDFLTNNPFCWEPEFANDNGEHILFTATVEYGGEISFDIDIIETNGFDNISEDELGAIGGDFEDDNENVHCYRLGTANRLNPHDWLYETATEKNPDVEDIESWFNDLDEDAQEQYKAEAFESLSTDGQSMFVDTYDNFINWLDALVKKGVL